MSKVFNMVGCGGKNISSIIITGLESTDTVTCTKDGKSYPATWDETALHWEIVGLPLGTFTITATNGTKTTTETVLIDIAGVYEIEMSFVLWLYKNGDEREQVTGGWSTPTVGTTQNNFDTQFDGCTVSKEKLYDGLKISGYRASVSGGFSHFFGSFYTNKKINLSEYSAIKVKLKSTCTKECFFFALPAWDTIPVGTVYGNWAKKDQDIFPIPVGTNTELTHTLDVSSLTSSYYISIFLGEYHASGGVTGNCSVLVDSIWVE